MSGASRVPTGNTESHLAIQSRQMNMYEMWYKWMDVKEKKNQQINKL